MFKEHLHCPMSAIAVKYLCSAFKLWSDFLGAIDYTIFGDTHQEEAYINY